MSNTPKKELWAHQKAAVAASESSEYDKHFIEIPCGCGKSRIIYKLIKNSFAKNETQVHLLVVPNLLLVDQFNTDFKLLEFNHVYVCSDNKFKNQGLHTTDPNKIISALNLKVLHKFKKNEVDIYEDTYEEYDQKLMNSKKYQRRHRILQMNTNLNLWINLSSL